MRLATLARPADRHRAAGSGTGLQALLDGWAPVLNAIGTNVFVADLDPEESERFAADLAVFQMLEYRYSNSWNIERATWPL